MWVCSTRGKSLCSTSCSDRPPTSSDCRRPLIVCMYDCVWLGHVLLVLDFRRHTPVRVHLHQPPQPGLSRRLTSRRSRACPAAAPAAAAAARPACKLAKKKEDSGGLDPLGLVLRQSRSCCVSKDNAHPGAICFYFSVVCLTTMPAAA